MTGTVAIGSLAINTFNEVDPSSASVLVNNVWPNAGPRESSLGSTTDGYYIQNVNEGCRYVIFESRGASGEAFCPRMPRLRRAGANFDDEPCIIDLATGVATSLLDDLGPGAVTLFGDAVQYIDAYFEDDPDSTLTSPKGVMHMISDTELVGNDLHTYVRRVEWNPDGVAGTPTRIHFRELALTRMLLVQDFTDPRDIVQPRTVTTAASGNLSPIGTGPRVFFHRPRRRYVAFGGRDLDNTVPIAGADWAAFAAQEPELDTIFGPHAITDVRTAQTSRFGVDARGDLGEPIAGVRMGWTIEADSTFREVVDTTGIALGGSPAAVANIPINDGDSVTSPVILEKLGVPMTEGAGADEFQINRATGVITFGANEPTAQDDTTYKVSYRHESTPATPAFGQLLDAESQTDRLGRAETRVVYPDDDNDAGQFDGITATSLNA